MRRSVSVRSKYSTDLNLVLNLPLYETGLKENIFVSYDSYAHKCSNFGSTWGVQGRTFGAGQYILLPNAGAIKPNVFCFSAWIYPTTTNSNAIIGWGTTKTSPNIKIYDDTRVLVTMNDAGAINYRFFNLVGSLLNAWTFISVNITGNTAADLTNSSLFYNGVTATPDAVVGNAAPDAKGAPHIGADGALLTNGFIGTIGNVILYDVNKTLAEHTSMYLATKQRYL